MAGEFMLPFVWPRGTDLPSVHSRCHAPFTPWFMRRNEVRLRLD